MNKAASSSNDIEIHSSGPSISPQCQKEVKFQLLQKHSSIKLNPLVVRIVTYLKYEIKKVLLQSINIIQSIPFQYKNQKQACEEELKAHCPKSSQSKKKYTNALECLKSLEHSKVGLSCRKALLVEEKEEAVMNSVDFALLKVCKHEIKNYNCAFQGKGKINGIFRCLKVSALFIILYAIKILSKILIQQIFSIYSCHIFPFILVGPSPRAHIRQNVSQDSG